MKLEANRFLKELCYQWVIWKCSILSTFSCYAIRTNLTVWCKQFMYYQSFFSIIMAVGLKD